MSSYDDCITAPRSYSRWTHRSEYNHLMSMAHFLFHGRLNDFLQSNQKGQNIPVEFKGRQTIKHLAESLGIPHPEIGRIQVHGREETRNFITQDRDQVDIYPL